MSLPNKKLQQLKARKKNGDPQDSDTHSSTSTSSSTSSSSSSWYNQPKPMIQIPKTWEQHVHPILNVLLHGSISSPSSLHKLRGQTSTLLRSIWEWYLSFVDHWDDEKIAFIQLQPIQSSWMNRLGIRHQKNIPFPHPQGITINMMPIKHSDYNTIPDKLSQYIPMIRACFDACPHEYDKICYLTIDERMVKKDECHRRGGIHVEAPGLIEVNDSGTHHKRMIHLGWGGGDVEVDEVHGGLFMSSNIDDTCAIWPHRITNDYVKGRYGSLEHMKRYIPGEPTLMKANTIYWLTDATPHASLPMPHDGYRQFFRLVTSAVTAWYADHSTPNPLGVKPDAMIIDGNKFV